MLPGKQEFLDRIKNEREIERQNRLRVINNNDLGMLAAQANQANDEFLATSKLVESSKDGDEQSKDVLFDSSRRAFYREFRNVVDNADVILLVLDARDPQGCRVPELEEMIKSSGGKKRLVLVLNKIDLVPKDVVLKWLLHLRKEYPTIAFKASTQQQRTGLGRISSDFSKNKETPSECLGGDTLIQLLKNYSRSCNIKVTVRVGVVGYPNVGKSSLINSLKRARVCGVGAAAGVTTARQEIHLDRNITLLDCPGIVFSRTTDDVLLRNCLRTEQIEDPAAAIALILTRTPIEQMMALYGIQRFENVTDFLTKIGRRSGKLKRGGVVDVDSAARLVIKDWNQGKIPFYTLPPQELQSKSQEMGDISLVSCWAPEFDLDTVEKLEVEHVMNSLDETCHPSAFPVVLMDMESSKTTSRTDCLQNLA